MHNRSAAKSLFFILMILSASALLITACGPKPSKRVMPNTPFNLKATAGNRTATIQWQVNRAENSPIRGYNIYLSGSPNTDGELFNSSPFPGDTDGDITSESFEIPRIDNGARYYAYVRTVMTDGSLSEASPRVSFMPLLTGQLVISSNHASDNSGYSFAMEKYTAARDFDNDFYIYATGEKAGISSPSRLHASLRESSILVEGERSGKFADTKPLAKGRTYILNTADNARVRMTLVKLSGNPALTATFDYIYYPPGVEP